MTFSDIPLGYGTLKLWHRPCPVFSLVFHAPGKRNFQTGKEIYFTRTLLWADCLRKITLFFPVLKGIYLLLLTRLENQQYCFVFARLCYKLQQFHFCLHRILCIYEVIDKGFYSQGFHRDLLFGFHFDPHELRNKHFTANTFSMRLPSP